MVKEVPEPWARRPISITSVIVATVLTPFLAPVFLVIAAIVDLVTRTPRMRRTRTVALIAGLILVDFAGFFLVTLCWLFSPLGWGVDRPIMQNRYSRIMTWWTNALIGVISSVTPLPFDRSQLDESLLGGNAIVVGRHRSLLDAVLPAAIFGRQGLRCLYVLKDDLQWEPNIDIVGHRMRHVFVNRNPQDLEKELEPIRELAARIDHESVGVIFPEGTFFNERRKARAVKSLERRNPAHAAAASAMNYVLPPRPAGTLAMLEAAPDADIVILGHVGFEPFGTIAKIFGNLGAEHDVVIRAWRFERDTVPIDPTEQVDWLFDRWAEMDRWIATHHPLKPRTAPLSLPDQ